ncbi:MULTISPECIES: TonB-dependent receptor [Prevotellaceae]|uniref:TonB-dependent receptor n=1 Tax=Prevotellaceae TaxID=171552 RepID=UPI000378D41F|nr:MULTISPECIES: TonB-dependent receptor [Prevotellaceae]
MGGIFIPLISFAQHSLSGRVVSEKDGAPVVNAAIYIKKNNVEVFTDKNGLYHIKLTQSGKYTIRVSFMGYNTVEQTVNIKGESTLNFTLKENLQELNEVVVSASAQKAEINRIRQSPMAVTVVDGEKLRGRSSGIEEILTRTSGIKVRKTGGLGSASRISVHGLEGKRVAVYINGFPLNSPDGSFDINDIPIDVIKYIEVYKGIVPAEYGGDGLGGAINIVTREDECDLVGFTQELASFGTFKTLASAQKLFAKPGILFNVAFFKNKSKNNYMMSWPVFETNLPASEYRKVRRNNDYYDADFYHVGIGFRKLYFDKLDLECAFYRNKKGIQSLNFDSRHAYTKSLNIMPTLDLEKNNFIFKGLDMRNTLVAPIIRSNMTDTATTKTQWDGTVTQAIGETEDNLFNESHNRQFELRNKLNLKYMLGRHSFNLNDQFVLSDYRPKDERMNEYLGFDPSSFPSKMISNNIGFSHLYVSSDNRFQNSLTMSIYYLKSKIFRTSDALSKDHAEDVAAPKQTSVNKTYYGFSEGVSYEFWKGVRGKISFSHNVRIPDTGELFGNGISIKPSVNLQPEVGNNLNVGIIIDRRNLCGLTRVQWETNFYYMYMKNMIRLFPADTRSIYTNLGKTSTLGFDTDIKVDVTPNIYAYFNLTLQDIRDRQKWLNDEKGTDNPTYDKHVPNIPSFYYNYGMEYHVEGLLGKKELSRVYVDVSHVGEFDWGWQMSTLPDQRKKWLIPSNDVFTIGLQQSFWHNNISLSFEVENIFDKENYMEFKMPLQGRTFKMKLRFNLFRDKVSGGAMSM